MQVRQVVIAPHGGDWKILIFYCRLSAYRTDPLKGSGYERLLCGVLVGVIIKCRKAIADPAQGERPESLGLDIRAAKLEA